MTKADRQRIAELEAREAKQAAPTPCAAPAAPVAAVLTPEQRRKARDHAYYMKIRDAKLAAARERRANPTPEQREAAFKYGRMYREANRDAIREQQRNYRQTHREELAAYARDYYAKRRRSMPVE